MARLTAVTLILVNFACSLAADHGLRLKSYSEDEAKGCYEYNQTLAVCFDVKKGSMKVHKTKGEEIVHYQELGPKIFLYQVLEHDFIGHGPSIFHVHEDVSRKPKALRAFLEDIKSKNGMEQHEALKRHYQAAMSELHYVPEVQLLERVSAALGDLTSLKILQPFHALCLSLLKASNVEIPDELKAAHDMKYQTADQHDPEKRSCSQPTENACRGMCGKGCSCWSWFCGDCCWHRGCYEHDLCCRTEYGLYTSYCAAPFAYGFTCEKFGGYPECESSILGWRRK